MSCSNSRPLTLVAALPLLMASLAAHADRPGFIPPPLGASDIPGETPAADIPGESAGIPGAINPEGKPQRTIRFGAWVRTDGDQAIDAMIRRLVVTGTLTRLAGKLGRRPVIRVLPPTVRTAERADGSALSQRAETLLRRSGQASVARPSAPADAVLLGYLGAFGDRAGRIELRSYLVGLSLVDVVTGEKLWVDIYRVRRLLRHQRAGMPKVQALPDGRAVDLSGRLADHDATAAARGLATKLRRSPWLKTGAPIRVRIKSLRNRSADPFHRRFLSLPFERALIALPRVTVLASRDELAAVRRVRALRGPARAELAATHVIRSTLTNAIDRPAGQPQLRLRTYRFAFEAIDASSNRKAWIGTHTIKKVTSSQ